MIAREIRSHVTSPWRLSWSDWKAVFIRTWKETSKDNVSLVAAGVAFYGFLALVPLLGAAVLSYGLIADPQDIIRHVTSMSGFLPRDAAGVIGDQLLDIERTSSEKKGLGLAFALALALFGARNGALSIIIPLNIAYEIEERRSFIWVNLLAFAITVGAVALGILAVIAIASLGHLEDLLPWLPWPALIAGKVVSYVVLVLAGAGGAATLYRFAPSQHKARWSWLTPGSVGAGFLWLAMTAGFGVYVANFANYGATYGSLAAVIVLLTWLYLSSYVLVLGAELNSELERQTSASTADLEGPGNGSETL
ncbi:YihY/virulence factor BrkB family protein (plasmid) [Novosphingobium sp. BL-8A]|uniref:YihY/virulence factor BrkB family protein n=1 Tax=Novosphingobium sp. BL-8A TaxID=3127639 RepID=UPI00375646C9